MNGTIVEIHPSLDSEGAELDTLGHCEATVLETCGSEALVAVKAGVEVWLPWRRLAILED